MSRSFPTTTRECNQLLEGINNELKLTIGEELLKKNKQEIKERQIKLDKERAEAKAAAEEAAKAAKALGESSSSAVTGEQEKKFVYPVLGTRLPTHMRREVK